MSVRNLLGVSTPAMPPPVVGAATKTAHPSSPPDPVPIAIPPNEVTATKPPADDRAVLKAFAPPKSSGTGVAYCKPKGIDRTHPSFNAPTRIVIYNPQGELGTGLLDRLVDRFANGGHEVARQGAQDLAKKAEARFLVFSGAQQLKKDLAQHVGKGPVDVVYLGHRRHANEVVAALRDMRASGFEVETFTTGACRAGGGALALRDLTKEVYGIPGRDVDATGDWPTLLNSPGFQKMK